VSAWWCACECLCVLVCACVCARACARVRARARACVLVWVWLGARARVRSLDHRDQLESPPAATLLSTRLVTRAPPRHAPDSLFSTPPPRCPFASALTSASSSRCTSASRAASAASSCRRPCSPVPPTPAGQAARKALARSRARGDTYPRPAAPLRSRIASARSPSPEAAAAATRLGVGGGGVRHLISPPPPSSPPWRRLRSWRRRPARAVAASQSPSRSAAAR
jgi:hypothetical protein